MKLEWLEDIIAVHETGSFAAAAEKRFVTASAFTRRIHLIEQSLDCVLFDRHKKPVVLYQHVIDKIEDIRQASNTLRELKMQLSASDVAAKQTITLICQHILTTSLVPDIIEVVFRELNINICVKSGTRNDAMLGLLKQEVQFVLAYEEVGEQSLFDGTSAEQFCAGYETLIPVAKLKNNPKLQERVDKLSIPIIAYPPNIYLGGIQKNTIFHKMSPGITIEKVAETALVMAIKEYAKRGIGVGWVPRSVVTEELESGELSSLEELLPTCQFNVKLSRFPGQKTQAAESFWTVIKEYFETPELI